MAWLVLVISGVSEAIWASALAVSHGLRRPGPTVLFAVSLVVSLAGLAGLAYAMQHLPAGTAYAHDSACTD